ncbi:MAG TPA: hypothetical protein VG387_04785 [Rhizomicrobium sp.]|jgi:hypothetical protein|nr:hypothetical protein [Rhizomicrobium sp.]
MLRLLELLFGMPFGREDRLAAFDKMVGGRSPQDAADILRWSAGHNTEKSGALLGAQAIFVVVDTFVLDRGWPRGAVLAALFLVLAAALILMTNLRSTMMAYRQSEDVDPNRHIFGMLLARTVRFNLALYMTFLSILFLGAAAWRFV